MVSLHSLEEHNFVVGLHGGTDPWLGARKNSGNFAWSDGTPWDFSNWAPSEPNNNGGIDIEDCVQMFMSDRENQWNDLRCNSERTFVCKKGKNY